MARRPVLQPRSICVLIFGDFQLLDPKVQASVRALLADTGITPAKAVERLRLASGPSIPPGRSTWWPAASASATPGACAAPSSAPSGTRRRRRGGWRARDASILIQIRILAPCGRSAGGKQENADGFCRPTSPWGRRSVRYGRQARRGVAARSRARAPSGRPGQARPAREKPVQSPAARGARGAVGVSRCEDRSEPC